MPWMRLQKILADAGVASRRHAEELIAAGRVVVDGEPARIGMRVDPVGAQIEVDGHRLAHDELPRVYFALHKPAGVTSTVSDPHASRTVLDLVPAATLAAAGRLYPVGRLDRDSEGLLLLTNDGPWAQRILHPGHGIEREYAVAARAPLSGQQADALRAGIELAEGLAAVLEVRPATRTETGLLLDLLGASDAGDAACAWYRVTLTQGWKRQVRRMFTAVGDPVVRLVRVRIGALRLGGLRPGALRALGSDELAALAAPPYPRRPGRHARPASRPRGAVPPAARGGGGSSRAAPILAGEGGGGCRSRRGGG